MPIENQNSKLVTRETGRGQNFSQTFRQSLTSFISPFAIVKLFILLNITSANALRSLGVSYQNTTLADSSNNTFLLTLLDSTPSPCNSEGDLAKDFSEEVLSAISNGQCSLGTTSSLLKTPLQLAGTIGKFSINKIVGGAPMAGGISCEPTDGEGFYAQLYRAASDINSTDTVECMMSYLSSTFSQMQQEANDDATRTLNIIGIAVGASCFLLCCLFIAAVYISNRREDRREQHDYRMVAQ